MTLFFRRIAMCFLSVIMCIGLYKGGIEMKKDIPVPEMNLSAVDITLLPKTQKMFLTLYFLSLEIEYNTFLELTRQMNKKHLKVQQNLIDRNLASMKFKI